MSSMKQASLLILFCCSTLGQASHPIENVIVLLQGLSAKTEAEGKAEALTYEKFEYWCANSKKTLGIAIAEEKTTIEELKSKIASKEEDEESLKDNIKKLEAELAKFDTAGIKAKDVRENGASLFAEADSNFKDTIAAVKEALAALEKARDDTEAASLLQKAMPFVEAAATEAQRQTLEAFLQEEPLKAEGDRAAHVDKYASKSHTVIELLKELVQKFEAEQLATTKAETNALNSYDVAKQARDNAVKAATLAKEKRETNLEDTQTVLKASREQLAETQGDLEADSASLSDTESSCAKKKREWEERSATRKGELEAMAMAIKILSKTTGVRTEPPSNPIPPASPLEGGSFLQISADGSPKSARALALLRAASAKANAGILRSRALERLAQEIASHLTGPFDKVNNMIEKMIFRLMAEQKNEDDHKNWCDLELEKTKTSINDKTEKKEDLDAKIADEKAAVQQLSEDIKEAEAMVADIVQHMKMSEEIRAIGKKENALAVKDSQDAQTAIAQAIAVLEDFYKSSGAVKKESWEFLQREKLRAEAPVELPEDPKTWDSSYTGLTDPKDQPNGIITTLEATAAEFSTMEADTKAQESADQKSFEDSTKDCQIEKTRRESESKEKTQERKNKEERIASLSKARKRTEIEIEKTDQYLTDLQPACVDGDSTYEDRKAARTQEVEALQEAQQILADAFKEDSNKNAKKDASFLQRHLQTE